MKQKLFKLFAVILCISALSACDNIPDMPDGFERLGGEKAHHFVHVHKEWIDEKMPQRRACEDICKIYGDMDYCEVIFWKKRKDVQTSLPIKNRKVRVGKCSLRDGKIKKFVELK